MSHRASRKPEYTMISLLILALLGISKVNIKCETLNPPQVKLGYLEQAYPKLVKDITGYPSPNLVWVPAVRANRR